VGAVIDKDNMEVLIVLSGNGENIFEVSIFGVVFVAGNNNTKRQLLIIVDLIFVLIVLVLLY
jgi:hypothetical protein